MLHCEDAVVLMICMLHGEDAVVLMITWTFSLLKSNNSGGGGCALYGTNIPSNQLKKLSLILQITVQLFEFMIQMREVGAVDFIPGPMHAKKILELGTVSARSILLETFLVNLEVTFLCVPFCCSLFTSNFFSWKNQSRYR